MGQEKQDAIYKVARAKLSPYRHKTVFIRNYTSKALPLVPGLVDFIYVDARHDFCGTWEDLTMWWTKLRCGRCGGPWTSDPAVSGSLVSTAPISLREN